MKEAKRVLTFLICTALLMIHVILARTAVMQKNAVYDEPLHTAAGWMVKNNADYRIDKEDPALFLWYAALPLSKSDLNITSFEENRKQVVDEHKQQWPFVTGVLYRTSGINGEALISRSQMMFLPITFLLGASIAWLAFKLGGPVAAIIAATMYAFDPNFLGHGAIVKNDVMLALFMMLFAINVWKVGQRATPWNVLSLGLLIGGALCVKFSGMLFVPMLMLAMLIRVVLPTSWKFMKHDAVTLTRRFIVAFGVCFVAGIISYITIWGVYRFRFNPSPDGSQQFNIPKLVWLAKTNGLLAKIGDPNSPPPTEAEIAQFNPGPLVKGIEFAESHKLLPQSWLAGLLYTHATTQIRATFLLGKYSYTGWWYFFPVAMLVKTPTATVAGFFIAIGMYCINRRMTIGRKGQNVAWAAASLGLPTTVYFLMAILSNLNLGLRHILPVYPILFVFVSLVLASWLDTLKGRWTVFTLGVLLVSEAVLAYPNYIAFFNTPSYQVAGLLAEAPTSKMYGRLNLLSDSSYDWGQDIVTLKRWQDRHPGVHIYFAGFGMADADAIGLERTDLADNRGFARPEPLGARPGVIAISATVLQGTYLNHQQRGVYGEFKRLQPREVLGETIFIYDWP